MRITDLRGAEQFESGVLATLRESGAELALGEHRSADVDWADWIVLSPAVSWTSSFARELASSGKAVESEITLVARQLRGTWVGVTGTNGKSTTVSLIAQMLRGMGRRSREGGNLGGSLLEHEDLDAARTTFVVELSSFQIEHLREVDLAPPVGVLTNVSPDHLDRHPSFAEYAALKHWLVRSARSSVVSLSERGAVDAGSPHRLWFGGAEEKGELATSAGVRLSCASGGGVEGWWSDELGGRAALRFRYPLLGEHNAKNLAAALCVLAQLGHSPSDVPTAAVEGLDSPPHRLREVRQVGGVRFVDDGVSTSPPAVIAALRSFSAPVHLLLGGYDKGIELRPLLREIVARGVLTYVFGAVGESFAAALAETQRESEGDGAGCRRFDTLTQAFNGSVRNSQIGDVILLSPGFASYDQYANFQERAVEFGRLVEALPG